ncbi:hypothetical protein ABMX52_17975, partial [Vibrio vulnificus]
SRSRWCRGFYEKLIARSRYLNSGISCGMTGLTETLRDNQDIDRFLDLLEKDIGLHPGKLIAPSPEMEEELDKIVGEYSVDLDGGY